jgi:hypothetical protein
MPNASAYLLPEIRANRQRVERNQRGILSDNQHLVIDVGRHGIALRSKKVQRNERQTKRF